MTALVVLPSKGDLRRRRGGEAGPDDVGDVEAELEEGGTPVALEEDGERRLEEGFGT